MSRLLLSAFFLFSIFVVHISAQKDAVVSDLGRSFRSFSLTRINTRDALRKAETMQRLAFETGDQNIEINLIPRDLRSPRWFAEDTTAEGVRRLARGPVTNYKGSIVGEPGSRVRLTIDGTKVEGFFVIRGEMYFIEPANRYAKGADNSEFVVYRAADVLRSDTFTCSSDLIDKIERGKEMIANSVGTSGSQDAIEIATEADFDFVNTVGTAEATNSKILSILNMSEGVYETELDLTISVVFQHTYSTGDPFDGTNASTLLSSFRNYWNTNYPTTQYPRDTAHLFTYKPNVRAQGYAYIGVICNNPSAAYGLSGRVDPTWGWEEANFLVTTHEIAHNLGANHSDTASGCSNTLMQATLSGSTQLTFCSFSRGEVDGFVGANGSCLTPVRSASTPFDFDGDGKTDTTIYRPSNGTWFIANSGNSTFNIFQFGMNGDKPVAADYDGDGKTDPAVFRGGVWWRMKSSNNTFDAVSFGLATDVPAQGDFDGDGKTDVAVFRPSTGVWHFLSSATNGYSAQQFGLGGDVPMPGDFDGDGKADVSVFRPSNGVWYRLNSGNGSFFSAQFGMTGDAPVPGDFDGDGKADLAVYRPSTGTWFASRSSDGGYMVVGFGLSTDVPLAGDYDGDGKADVAVWRPSTGVWHRLNSASGSYLAYQFGISSDVPVQAR